MSEFRKVTAIIRTDALERVEDRLVRERVKGISVSYVKGYGEYKNFFTQDWLSRHVRIEIYTAADAAESIAAAIVDAANVGLAGDGLVAILPVEKVFRIRTRCECKAEEL